MNWQINYPVSTGLWSHNPSPHGPHPQPPANFSLEDSLNWKSESTKKIRFILYMQMNVFIHIVSCHFWT